MLAQKNLFKLYLNSFFIQIAVIGAGQMGTGIAIVASRVGGKNVKVVDTTQKALDASKKFTESWCDKEIAKARLTNDEKTQVLQRFTFTTKLEDLNDTDFVVEVSYK